MKQLGVLDLPYPSDSRSDSGLALASVSLALRRLRAAVSVPALFSDATALICQVVGFERAVLFSLRGHALIAESAYALSGTPAAGRASIQPRADSFELGPWLRESEVLRQRRATLVKDAANDPRALGMLPGTHSYVIAPLVCQSRAVGLIHADRGSAGGLATELDRDTLSAFAEGFGCAVERALLAERLRTHSKRLLELMRSTEASVTELSKLEMELPGSTEEEAAAGGGGRVPALEPQTDLTRREVEVLVMLADGETNGRIAERLVVSEGTVKTHVKHILRKLGVHNRSQAVSRYFRDAADREHRLTADSS